jgi:hypothetical protein
MIRLPTAPVVGMTVHLPVLLLSHDYYIDDQMP